MEDSADSPWSHSTVMLSTHIKMHFVHLSPHGVRAKGTVLCVHGFPDTWFGYRRQIRSLVARGWHVVVPDQRGYGETDAPRRVSDYRMELLCADMCALMDVLGVDKVVLLGHDWGGTLVWNMALQHRERVAAVAAVCTPFFPNNPASNPWKMMKSKADRFNYQIWFNAATAEEELAKDVEYTLKCTIRSTEKSDVQSFMEHADANLLKLQPTEKGGILKGNPPADKCPRSTMLSASDLAYYGRQFTYSGFFGPCSWYRNVEENWKWMQSTAGQKILQPALMISCGRDEILKASMVQSLRMHEWIPSLAHRHVEEAGHWVLQEKPQEVNAHICEWLDTLPPLVSSL